MIEDGLWKRLIVSSAGRSDCKRAIGTSTSRTDAPFADAFGITTVQQRSTTRYENLTMRRKEPGNV